MSRFSEPHDPIFRALDSSIGYDWRLGPYDVEQSRAHATMLAAAGIIGEADRDALLGGLDRVAAELEDGDVPVRARRRRHPHGDRAAADRDRRPGRRQAAHRALAQRPGRHRHGDVHARARADAALERAAAACRACSSQLAERHLDWAMPGYTHLQRAQPVYLSHHLLAYFWMFRPRRAALRVRARRRPSELPLGAGALAGVNFATDRGLLARELGFAGVAPNSIDAVSNRDFVLDFLAAAATCATHLSRLGAEIVLWSSEEFGFCEVVRRLGVGLLDHAAEEEPRRRRAAAREGAARRRAPGRRSTACMHGLPLTYNKDMQEDKEHLFDAVDTLELCLAGGDAGCSRGSRFDRERLAGAAADELIAATDVADLLVAPRRAVPPVARDRRRARARGGRVRARRSPSSRARSSRAHSDALDDEFYAVLSQRVVARVQGLRGRHGAGARARAARARARGARRPAGVTPPARLLRPAGPRGRPRPASAASSRHGDDARA